jgi:hypothetical protein
MTALLTMLTVRTALRLIAATAAGVTVVQAAARPLSAQPTRLIRR